MAQRQSDALYPCSACQRARPIAELRLNRDVDGAVLCRECVRNRGRTYLEEPVIPNSPKTRPRLDEQLDPRHLRRFEALL